MNFWLTRPHRPAQNVLRAFLACSSGQMGLFFGIAALPLLLAAGAAVDMSRVARARTSLQAAVDAGAIAAARGAHLDAAARQQIAKNTVRVNLGALAAQINATINETETGNQFTVTATANVPTTVMKLMRMETAPISAKATAAASPSAMMGNVCILAKSTSAAPGMTIVEEARMFAPDCEIHVASLASPAAVIAKATTLNSARLCVAGDTVSRHPLSSATNISTHCAVATDPFAGALPVVPDSPCTVTNGTYSGDVTLSPGVYCGAFDFTGAGVITLDPGLYVLKHTHWELNPGSTISGAGVSFYFTDAESFVRIKGGATAILSPPTTGPYSDILMFEPPGLEPSSLLINGSPSHDLSGLFYLPSRNVFMNVANAPVTDRMTLVVNTVGFGTDGWKMQSSAERQIKAPRMTPPRLLH